MKHIWIQSLTIDDKGNFSQEQSIILSPSLETKYLKLKATADKTINDTFIKVSFTTQSARIKYYKNPIHIGDKAYIMYKRSASSSRQGNVLFIRSDLFEKMDKWSNCGIDLSSPENSDRVSTNFLAFQAYKALTLSGAENFIHLNPKNILVIEDVYSTFVKMALFVSDKKPTGNMFYEGINKEVFAYEDYGKRIKNSIWDGQGFLDDSVFETPDIDSKGNRDNYKNNAMMILRNRFFKSCVFRTRLQAWFRDNGFSGEISRDSQGMPTSIHGYTEAERYEDIKMVVTQSSLKYIKFFDEPLTAIKQWMNTVNDLFGIVITDKPTPYFGGQYVRTNYQLLNTIYMTSDKTGEFLAQNINMIQKINTDSKAFITYVESTSGRMTDITEEKEVNADPYFDSPFKDSDQYFNPRLEVCRELVRLNSKFDNTYFYKVFIRDYVEHLSSNIEIGKVLVEGTYATIVSNPYEMLKHIIKQFSIEPGQEGQSLTLQEGELYSRFFDNGEYILGSRSPHILPGNILVSKNNRHDKINQYFVFNPQIVCINSIGSLILHKLNGSDQDGDQIFLTNNRYLLEKARRFDDPPFSKFTVPVNSISDAKKTHFIHKGKVALTRFAKADHKLSNNLIGKIVNLSQKYNSILWDTFIRELQNNTEQMYWLRRPYFYNCILEVLSNNEIDAAKGKTDFESKNVLKKLEEIANTMHKNDPLFFIGIKEKKTQIEVDDEVENKGKLALADEILLKSLWFERTTSNLSAISFQRGGWKFKNKDYDFNTNIDTKNLMEGDEITLLFVIKKHPNSVSRRAVLMKKDQDLHNFNYPIHCFNDVREAIEYKNYSEKELYLVKGKIARFSRFKYDKYETTMDYVYEHAQTIKPNAGGQGIRYTKLSECYKQGEGLAPKNNCEADAKLLIQRLILAEKVRRIIFKNALSKEDRKTLQAAQLKEDSTLLDYKAYLLKCADFEGSSFFASKDRLKSLIRMIDENQEKDIQKVFYLALYLMFNDPKAKYKEIFAEDLTRKSITNKDVEQLLDA